MDRPAIDSALSRLAAAGVRAAGSVCDVSRGDAVAGMVAEAVEKLGGLDIMVANAGERVTARPQAGRSARVRLRARVRAHGGGALTTPDARAPRAGIVKAAPFLEMSEADFDSVISVNLKGVFLSCQAAARRMVDQGRGGSIICMSSVNGVMAIPTIAGYNAAKGGRRGARAAGSARGRLAWRPAAARPAGAAGARRLAPTRARRRRPKRPPQGA